MIQESRLKYVPYPDAETSISRLFFGTFCVYARADQEKPNAAHHLLPHTPTGLHVMQSCAGVNFYGLGKRGAR